MCAADEVWRLQRGSQPDCVFFQRTVNRGERITDRGTRQGTWVIAPSGTVLARCNTRDVDLVLETLANGRLAWERLPAEERRLPAGSELETPRHRWEQSYPAGGLVLERIARGLSADGLEAEPAERWNRDYVWFAAAEVAEWIPAAAAEGERIPLPLLANRLARFHLVDNVRGQTIPFADEEVEADLVATVVAVDAEWVELELTGTTRAVAAGPWLLGFNYWKPRSELPHGVETRLVGHATWNRASRAFEDVELVATGVRWGRTDNNGRRKLADTSLVVFHLMLAPSDVRMAPAFVAVYGADWIEMPDVAAWLDSPAECGLTDG